MPDLRSEHTALDSKYVVFKVGDGEPISGDFFVIREQDVFGAAALYGYAHVIRSVLELSVIRDVELEPAEEHYLSDLADRVQSTADAWMARRNFKRIPT